MTKEKLMIQLEKNLNAVGPLQIYCKEKKCRYVLSDEEILNLAGEKIFKEYLSECKVI